MPTFSIFTLTELEAERKATDDPWFEFLRVPTLRSGLYVLAPGAWDHQTPHEEDELYVVMRGRAMFEAGAGRRPVSGGTIIFVAAGQEHRFSDIEEELCVLVFFSAAPPSTSRDRRSAE